MYLGQITELGDQISKFVAANGVLAFLIVIAALTLLAVFGGLVYVLSQVVKMQDKQLDASEKRDQRIDRVSVKIDDVAQDQNALKSLIDTNTKAFDKVAESVDKNTELTGSTIKSYATLEEQFVSSYDATSKAIGLSGLDIKKNSDSNTTKIITEVQKLPTAADIRRELEEPFQQIRDDIGKIIDPDLATKVMALIKPDMVNLVETAFKTCLEENAKLVKELDHADKVIDNIVKPPPPDPEPPDGSGAKAPIPLDSADSPDLTKTERAA